MAKDVFVTETPRGTAYALFNANPDDGRGVTFDDADWPASDFMLDLIRNSVGPGGIGLDPDTIDGETYHGFCQPKGSGVTITMPEHLRWNPEVDGPEPADDFAMDAAPAPDRIERARSATNQTPTERQKATGNYRKGSVYIHGLHVKIENPKGTLRRGKDAGGKEWCRSQAHDYGYLKGIPGADGDPLDVFLGPDHDSDRVFVIDQRDGAGQFDEHKVMLGFRNEAAARAGYLDCYEAGWTGLGRIREFHVSQFKSWARTLRKALDDTGGDGAMPAGFSGKIGGLMNRLADARGALEKLGVAREILNAYENSQDVPPPERVTGPVTRTSHLYAHDGMRTAGRRQRANNAAIALFRQIRDGKRDPATLTDDDKRILAAYSGNGGSLIGEDGKRGSDYEYYTPTPIAAGIWELLGDMGFKGGKALDPSSGTGVFNATAPLNVVVDQVELDEVSGGINAIINDGPGNNVTVSNFESVAAATPDEQYDAIVTNVPFGSVSARGDNLRADTKYQNEPLEAYFILRSLEKLKPGGLAAFIVPPRVVSGRDGQDMKLRRRAAIKAEFRGAFRLPNSVFGNANADTITDVVIFRKYGKEAAEKIGELLEQDPGKLEEVGVFWPEYMEGRYFEGDGRRFQLGEYQAPNPDDFRPTARVVSPLKVPEIAKLLRRLPESRVNWDALAATETMPIVYNEGDTIHQAGQTLVLRGGVWVALPKSQRDSGGIALLARAKDAYTAWEGGMTYDDAITLREFMVRTGRALDLPGWLAMLLKEMSGLSEDAQRAAWLPAIVGLSVEQVLNERGRASGTDFASEFERLSDAMKSVAAQAKGIKNVSGSLRRALGEIGVHYHRSRGFSAVWTGDIEDDDERPPVSTEFGFEGLLYGREGNWVPLDEAREALGADFDPMASDDWCISADGSQVIRADDFYSGNVADVMNRIDADLVSANSDEIRNKLIRMKAAAAARIDKVDVSRVQFNLHSPLVSIELKLEFLRRYVDSRAAITFDANGKPQIEFDIPTRKDTTDKEKLIRRIGSSYLKNGTITLGGTELSMSKKQGLAELRKMVAKANEQFNTWASSQSRVRDALDARASDPTKQRFREVSSGDPINIPNLNPDWTLHTYQNAYVRARARMFEGINGFDVGLGKTTTALATVEYAQSRGIKKRTLFVVPNAVLSNWKKETGRTFTDTADCLYVGLRNDKVQSSKYDEDLNAVMTGRYRKVFMSYEAFERIRLTDETIDQYEAFLRATDSSYAESERRKDDERNKGRVSGLREILGEKSGSAPYLEDMGIDSIVIDEGHNFKNSAETVEFKGAKYLGTAQLAKRGADAQAKAWYIRGLTPKKDGVIMLTASPITNSPLEIYSMLSLAVGHERVNDAFLGIHGADDFMEAMTDVVEEEVTTIDGIDKIDRVFKGLNNADMLRTAFRQTATIEDAESVGASITVPDASTNATAVSLDEASKARLSQYKLAFRYAIDAVMEYEKKTGKPNRGDKAAFEAVSMYFGEPMELLANPFNLADKMEKLILDPDMDQRLTRWLVPEGDIEKAKAIVAKWNDKPPTEKRDRLGPNATDADVKSTKTIKEDGEIVGYEYTINIKAWMVGNSLMIDSMSPATQDKMEAALDKAGIDVDVQISPKIAAMLENFREEAANPRGIDADGRKVMRSKQIIFCDRLPVLNKIKRLLRKRAGVSDKRIAIITGATKDMQEVQDGFNGTGEEAKYDIIIANKKAEVGINLQKGTQAIHHLSIGWTPDSLQQRNGRGVRQGNKTDRVSIYYYDADGTFDEAKRAIVASKASWIGELMSRDGGDHVEVAGGMSDEMVDALIESMGDPDAVARIREQQAQIEREQRAGTNREKQRINLDTIATQRDFLKNNPRAWDWVARKLGQALVVSVQRGKLMDRMSNPKTKMSETAYAKNRQRVAELDAQYQGMLKTVSDAASFWTGKFDSEKREMVKDYPHTEYTPAEVIDLFQSQAKRGETSPEHFVEGLRKGTVGNAWTRIFVEIKDENSELIAEWKEEVATAEALRDEAIAKYEKQAEKDGALPSGAARHYADGTAVMSNEMPVFPGVFFRHDGFLWVAGESGYMSAIDASTNGENSSTVWNISADVKPIYPGTAEHEQAMVEAAALEDAAENAGVTRNVYNLHCPDVAQRRETKTVARYSAREYAMPAPLFPVMVNESAAIDSAPVLRRIFDEQSAGIVRREGGLYSPYFVVASDVDVEKRTRQVNNYGNEIGILSMLGDYAISRGLTLTKGDIKAWGYELEDEFSRTMREKMGGSLASSITEGRMDLPADFSEADVNAMVRTKVEQAIPWFGLGENFKETIRSYISWQAGSAWDELLIEAQRRAMGDQPEPEPAPPPPVPSAIEGRPGDLLKITGNTKRWKEEIKATAKMYGAAYKFQFQKYPYPHWVIERRSWDKLIERYPRAAQELQAEP